jgi:5-methylcytosine-specific restriction endonuclease McrA
MGKSTGKNLRYNIMFYKLKPTCLYCEKLLKKDEMTLEHVLPKKHGGTNHWKNLDLACLECNSDKADMLLTQYIKGFDIVITKRIENYL